MLRLSARAERPWVRAGDPEQGVMRFLVDLEAGPASGANLAVCFVLDASGTMRRFELSAQDLARLLAQAESRGELRLVDTDRQSGGAFTGETLAAAQTAAAKPIGLAVDAIKRMVTQMPESAQTSVVAFAEREAVVHEGAGGDSRQAMFGALDLLARDDAAFEVGDGTRMAGALARAREWAGQHTDAGRIARVIALTDGVVHDPDETLKAMEAMRQAEIGLTTVGIGSAFDEEFLTRAADRGGGDYYYAAQAPELADRLAEELHALTAVAVRGVRLAVTPREGGAIGEIVQVRPRMRLFDEVEHAEECHTVSVGDVAAGAPTSVAVTVGLPDLGVGAHAVASARAAWEGAQGEQGEAETELALRYAPAEEAEAERSAETADLFDRLDVYLAEREAQWAKEDGDLALATRRLETATRLLRSLGEHELAREFEAHMGDLQAPGPEQAARAKRIKAETRRLTR